jgi:hypothetical protein
MSCIVCRELFGGEEGKFTKFSFPTDFHRLKLWKIACGKSDSWAPNTSSKICEKHFAPESIMTNSLNKVRHELTDDAVPTIECHRKFFKITNKQNTCHYLEFKFYFHQRFSKFTMKTLQ